MATSVPVNPYRSQLGGDTFPAAQTDPCICLGGPTARFRLPAAIAGIAGIAWLLALPCAAHAEEAETAPAGEGTVERLQESISERVLETADRIDTLLGADIIEEESQRSTLRLRLDTDYDETDDTTTVGVRINARVHLPKTEGKLSLLLSGDGDEDDGPPSEDDDEETAGLRGDAESSLALRFEPQRSRATALSFDLGLRRRESRYRAYGRARARRNFNLGERWAGTASNKLYYFSRVGFEDELKIDLERIVGEKWLFRSETIVDWFERDSGVFPEQHFSLYRRLGQDGIVAFDWRNFFSTRPESQLDESQVRVRYRRSVKWRWFFLEVRPVLAFPEDQDYDATWRLKLRLEALFGAV